MGDAGEKAVRDAVKGRSGFVFRAVENDGASTVNMCGSLLWVLCSYFLIWQLPD
jgi:hypothetical protein